MFFLRLKMMMMMKWSEGLGLGLGNVVKEITWTAGGLTDYVYAS